MDRTDGETQRDVVICATRAGEHSRLVHTNAFAHAKSHGSALVFVHVLGGPTFDEQSEPMRDAIRDEVEWLVQALVRLAQQRARAGDVPMTVEIAEGDVVAEIVAAISSHGASHLIMGDPRNGDETTFQDAALTDFTNRATNAGAEITLVAT